MIDASCCGIAKIRDNLELAGMVLWTSVILTWICTFCRCWPRWSGLGVAESAADVGGVELQDDWRTWLCFLGCGLGHLAALIIHPTTDQPVTVSEFYLWKVNWLHVLLNKKKSLCVPALQINVELEPFSASMQLHCTYLGGWHWTREHPQQSFIAKSFSVLTQ